MKSVLSVGAVVASVTVVVVSWAYIEGQTPDSSGQRSGASSTTAVGTGLTTSATPLNAQSEGPSETPQAWCELVAVSSFGDFPQVVELAEYYCRHVTELDAYVTCIALAEEGIAGTVIDFYDLLPERAPELRRKQQRAFHEHTIRTCTSGMELRLTRSKPPTGS